MRPETAPWLVYACLIAGAVDTVTGALLMASPTLALGLMGVAPMPAEPIYLRFIGAFVAGVGISYVLPFRDRPNRDVRLVAMLEMTAFVRFAVGGFVAVAVLCGALGPAWSTVAVTDLGLATAQVAIVRNRKLRHSRRHHRQ